VDALTSLAYDVHEAEGTPSLKRTAETVGVDTLLSNASNWMLCRLQTNGRTIIAFADSGASRNFISKTLATSLKLKIRPQQGKVSLEGGKTLPSYGSVNLEIRHREFYTKLEAVVVDLHAELILGQPFWKTHRVAPDYVRGGVVVHKGEKIWHVGIETPPVRMLENEQVLKFGQVQLRMIGHRRVSKVVKKNKGKSYDVCLWMIREGFDSTKEGEEERTTGDDKLDTILGPLLSCFRTNLPRGVPPKRWVDHAIDTGGAKPVNRPTYALSASQFEEQEKQIKYLVERELIRPSTSSWGAPVLFVRKKDGTWRMCIDYRALNAVTVRNTYPLPRIDECLDQLQGARIFSKLDCLSGYWQVRIQEQDRHKTAFNTRTGKWEFCVLPFGLNNAPSTFQKMMNDILREYIGKFVLVYIDDILIFSRTEEEHREHVRLIFQKLQENNLFVKPSKCEFFRTEIKFCGFVVGGGKIQMDPAKVRTIQEYPRPETVHHVRAFCGLCSWYRHFIKDFAAIASPLYELIRNAQSKHALVQWGVAAEAAFVRLKEKMCQNLVLLQPNLWEAFVIETDASDFAYGAVLLQMGEDGKEHPVAYLSHALSDVERRYPTHERELLAVKSALRQWEKYISNGKTTVVRTDHEGLQYMNTIKKPTPKLARWISGFQTYDIELKYKPGKTIVVPDALSR
jgi:hypothetical protein